jgi:hypothetical protein
MMKEYDVKIYANKFKNLNKINKCLKGEKSH